MKKHQLVAAVGTLALVANLLVPGMSFAANQTGNVTVGCDGTGAGPSISTTPGTVTFDSKTASGTPQDSFDSLLGDGAPLNVANMIVISDTRSKGSDNCPDASPGWTLTASATDLTSGSTAQVISNSTIRVITSNQFAAGDLGTFDALQAGEHVLYPTGAPLTGFAHDVTAPVEYDNAAQLFNTMATYTGTNTLNSSVTLLDKTLGQNGDVATGVALAIDQGINAYQAAATYTGTITYSVLAS